MSKSDGVSVSNGKSPYFWTYPESPSLLDMSINPRNVQNPGLKTINYTYTISFSITYYCN